MKTFSDTHHPNKIRCIIFLYVIASAIQPDRGLASVPAPDKRSSEAVVLQYEKLVRVEGTIRLKESFGAPNYDETSKKEGWYYVLLNKPINVSDGNNPQLNYVAENNVKEIQLILNGHTWKSLLGKK